MDWVQWSISQRRQMALMQDFWLIDKTWWQEQVTEHFDLTRKYHQQIYGDQGILNLYFKKMRGIHYLEPIILSRV